MLLTQATVNPRFKKEAKIDLSTWAGKFGGKRSVNVYKF